MQEQPQQRQSVQGANQAETTQEVPVNFPQGTADQLPTLAEWNNKYIDYVLNYTKGKKTAAARILGINRRTLYRRNKSKSSDTEAMLDGDSTH